MIKNTKFTLGLMYFSVLLIVLFQVYWLVHEYNRVHKRMHREIGVVIRETFVKKQFQQFFSDSTGSDSLRNSIFVFRDRTQKTKLDSPVAVAGFNIDTNQKRNDHIHDVPNEKNTERGRQRNSRFMSLDADKQEDLGPNLIVKVPMSDIDYKEKTLIETYKKALEEANLPIDFVFRKAAEQPKESYMRFRGNANNPSNNAPFTIIMTELDYGNAFPYIYPRLYGQFLFSIIMTTVVAMAFFGLYRGLRQQQKLAVLKNDFISNMTHELKTPIATVSVAIEALRNFNAMSNPERTREYLDISTLELNRINMLIDKVLRINMFEADKLEIEAEPLDLKLIADQVIQSLSLQAEKQQAIIRFDAPNEPMMVKGDRFHLLSVLYNLLDNALKYNKEKPEIDIRMVKQGTQVLCSVSDNGTGIATEYQKKVFEKFFRIPTGDRHDIKGYGLGLSYVSEIVQKHGGQIKIESTPGKGSTFIVSLPALT